MSDGWVELFRVEIIGRSSRVALVLTCDCGDQLDVEGDETLTRLLHEAKWHHQHRCPQGPQLPVQRNETRGVREL